MCEPALGGDMKRLAHIKTDGGRRLPSPFAQVCISFCVTCECYPHIAQAPHGCPSAGGMST